MIESRISKIPAVVYAAKSTEDTRGSLGTQLSDCRSAIAGHHTDGQTREIVGEFQDEARSAYKGNRGPGLESAKQTVIEAAKATGCAELWVQHSDRLARGDGLTADHLGEVYFAMRRCGVRLRSVQDDSNLEDAIRVVLIGERNHEDSRRKSNAVKDGKRRQKAKGERPGGPVPDGYKSRPAMEPGSGKRIGTNYFFDRLRQTVIARMWELAESGLPPAVIARGLNAEGHRKASGRPWDRRGVESKLLNSFYAGGIAWPGEDIDWEPYTKPEHPKTEHPTYVSREVFERILAQRSFRDSAKGSNRSPGSPRRSHLLTGLARCSRCGEPMYGRSSTYRRKSDGGRRRHYLCSSVHNGTGTCDAPKVNAEVIDAALAENLPGLVSEFDRWTENIAAARTAEQTVIESELKDRQAELSDLDRKIVRVEDRYAAADGEDAEAILDVLRRLRADRVKTTERAKELAVEAERVAQSEQGGTDGLLDFYLDLRRSIDGALGTGSLMDANAALALRFAAFWIDTGEAGVSVVPELHPEMLEVLVWDRDPAKTATVVSFENPDQSEGFPTLIAPEHQGPNSQE